jgi:transcriptional regulator with PAS, ATPase and Fis domain
VVAATLRDLAACITDGTFREDLYYRLNVIEVALPPLRDRASDIPGLARLFVDKYARKFGRPAMGISPASLDALSRYRWPGNIRELENVIERAMILEEGPEITVSSLSIREGKGAREDLTGSIDALVGAATVQGPRSCWR